MTIKVKVVDRYMTYLFDADMPAKYWYSPTCCPKTFEFENAVHMYYSDFKYFTDQLIVE
jgi:hypothetical protein